VIVGPLIDLASGTLPAWIASDGDSPTLAAYFCDFIETIVQRYKDRVRDWILCTGFNYADLHQLSQDDRLRLVVKMLEAGRSANPEARWVIGVSQPWGEYMDQPDQTVSPLVFCDTLLRTGLSISGFMLELFAGRGSRSSHLRDGLELLRLFELYGLLGVPLDLSLRHPGHNQSPNHAYTSRMGRAHRFFGRHHGSHSLRLVAAVERSARQCRVPRADCCRWPAEAAAVPLATPAERVARMSPLAGARLMLVTAAVLWSTSSIFIRLLQRDTSLALHQPSLSPLQIGFFRSLFAGLVVLLLVHPRQVRFRWPMAGMALCFGIMTGLYVSALAMGSAANAILLQNTAPVWVYAIGVWLLKDRPGPRTFQAIVLAAIGAITIVLGNAQASTARECGVLAMGAGSGFFYALVVLFLRHLSQGSAPWLTAINLIGSAAVIFAGAMLLEGTPALDWLLQPTAAQLLFIAAYGIVQLAGPYILFVRALRSVSPQEAGIITLIEPVLNPVWAYLISPGTETPTVWTLSGGGILLAALAWQYWPQGRRQ
jgi:drug/metabolite transporter, DME family